MAAPTGFCLCFCLHFSAFASYPAYGLGYAVIANVMKRAAFKLQSGKGGWIRTTIAPINDKSEATFGFSDILMFTSLVAMMVALARILLAH